MIIFIIFKPIFYIIVTIFEKFLKILYNDEKGMKEWQKF